MIKDIVLALIAVLGPIISGVWSYKSSVKKAEADLKAVREKNKTEIESIKIQAENELEKIREQSLSEGRLYEEKLKLDLLAKQFSNPKVQKRIEEMLDKEFSKRIYDI
ncbi:hypothetical protein [Amphibacillus xylanus]|uniref:Uncharacterized protein n=1 Tax=Amphibacillus xylanus (strain ATCC 51415 / DSM 6626 / JCM 7361 / LMG 17667 / NBRC 15112 / Ep01) TaxID=698758 RepID=K0IVA2_AMPXN|nr:hypothetical protein [Amphibacillus xylanus]BAM46359.1 hypothetical protein AXY_02270 [Amphibacillus xylanus NBRC 15112]